jgi:hypothetical protein
MSGNTALDFNAPDGIEPIVGWRTWVVMPELMRRVEADDWLRSLHRSVWVPGERMEAVCTSPGLRRIFKHGRAPEEGCHCGVYAFQNIDPLMSMLHVPLFEPVLGEVSLWGKIIVHEDGYRARFAYPKRLWVDKSFPERFKRTLMTYGVPVTTTQDEEFRLEVEKRVDFMEPEMKDIALAYLGGEECEPLPRCLVCQRFMLPEVGICPHCDPGGALRDLKRREKENRRQIWTQLHVSGHSFDQPGSASNPDSTKWRVGRSA